ncbi:hypothetical protein CLIM01_13920 [Colletotrichum limetticola]|uniref:Uncharacterized protein n=1 Tax=Colletotrichum limetticola TaxID=1209924 RepID=A0ABQ9P9F6_9PEZI|nr:hypothetical protein CLIM01_13920 [Colletotrichum limetticola]
MAVPFDVAQLDESEKSVFNIAIDGQTQIRPSVHPEAMGSRFLSFIQVEHPIKEILESDDLTALSLLIRRAIIAIDKKVRGSFINVVIKLVNNKNDLGALISTSFLDAPGQKYAHTYWETFKMAI